MVSDGTLTVGPGLATRGWGVIGEGLALTGSVVFGEAMSLVNQGTMIADHPDRPLHIKPKGVGATFSNQGVVRIEPGGVLQVSGMLTQEATARVEATIQGAAANQYGRISVSQTATLDGELAVTFADGYAPNLGDMFEVVVYGSRVGEFASIAAFNLGGDLSVKFPLVVGALENTAALFVPLGATPPDQFEPVSRLPKLAFTQVRDWLDETSGNRASRGRPRKPQREEWGIAQRLARKYNAPSRHTS